VIGLLLVIIGVALILSGHLAAGLVLCGVPILATLVYAGR
jgi:hypothetical protein